MSKKIVFSADGTWNHPQSPALVEGQDTNVYKLHKSLAISASQIAFYDDGVGADGTVLNRLLGGAFGAGLFQKIKDGYTAIAHVYEQDDEIYIFGFSRGAYTARSLAGMIAICGLPTKGFNQQLVETAFQAYRNKDQRAALLATLAPNSLYNAKIKMLGVWDTVGSLGIPGGLFGINEAVYGFLDTGLHPDVQHAYQALAVDERRSEFIPTLWKSDLAPGQVMEQIWFPGVHSDVGGGYEEPGLSDIPLSWMLSKAMALGIETNPAAATQYQNIDPKNSLDQLHESWSPLWGFPKHRSVPQDALLANSIGIRLGGHVGYRPANLNINSAEELVGYATEPVVTVPITITAKAAGS